MVWLITFTQVGDSGIATVGRHHPQSSKGKEGRMRKRREESKQAKSNKHLRKNKNKNKSNMKDRKK